MPLLVVDNSGGLGNRIKAIISAFRLSENVAVRWKKGIHISSSFSAFFDNRIVIGPDKFPIRAVNHTDYKFAVLPTDVGIPKKSLSFLHTKIEDNLRIGRYLEDLYDKIPEIIKQELVKCAQKLRINSLVEKALRDCLERLAPDFISVHIRTWRDDKRRNLTFHLASYISMMKQFRGGSFLVCSDSDACLRKLKALYGSRITLAREIIAQPQLLAHDQIAFLEMLLLGSGKNLIVTEASTFAEAGFILRGANAKAHLVRPNLAGINAVHWWDSLERKV